MHDFRQTRFTLSHLSLLCASAPLWLVLPLLAACATLSPHRSDTRANIRVVIWDERQKQQHEGYGDMFLGGSIAQFLRGRPGFSVVSVGQEEYHDPPSIQKLLEGADVLIWWGHLRHDEIRPEVGRMIVQRIKAGNLGLVALHSAHWSTPFVEAMNERARIDARRQLAQEAGPVEIEELPAPGKMQMFRALPRLRELRGTPRLEMRKYPDGRTKARLIMPWCVFPAFREDAKPSQVFTRAPHHPIAKGVPERFTIPHTEMYDEPFMVPEPDAVVFEERWDTGEWFRSGCAWDLGAGRVFYFRPGHETFGIYKEQWPLKIIENAARWAAGDAAKESRRAGIAMGEALPSRDRGTRGIR